MVDEAALRAPAEERLELAREALDGPAALRVGEGRPWDLLLMRSTTRAARSSRWARTVTAGRSES